MLVWSDTVIGVSVSYMVKEVVTHSIESVTGVQSGVGEAKAEASK